MERRYRPAGRGSSRFLGYRYPQDENDPNQYGMGDLKADLAFARFVDNDHVVTFNKKGLLSFWNLPKCERIYEYTGVSNSLGIDTTVAADGTAVLLPAGDLFHFADGKNSLAVWPGTRPTG